MIDDKEEQIVEVSSPTLKTDDATSSPIKTFSTKPKRPSKIKRVFSRRSKEKREEKNANRKRNSVAENFPLSSLFDDELKDKVLVEIEEISFENSSSVPKKADEESLLPTTSQCKDSIKKSSKQSHPEYNSVAPPNKEQEVIVEVFHEKKNPLLPESNGSNKPAPADLCNDHYEV